MTGLYRYSLRALAPDYAGALLGSVVSLGVLGLTQPALPVAVALVPVAVLFLVYFARTVCRQLTHIELDETGIRAKGPSFVRTGGAIRWADLRLLRLDYYSTRADREEGWMQLKLGDAQRTIRLDSGLDGFARIANIAAQEAARRNLALDAATVNNLLVLRS